MEIRIEGLDKLMNLLDGMVGEQAITDGITESCKLVEEKAKKDCPKDTSKLAESIHYQVKPLEGIVGTDVEYGPYVEIGTGIFSSLGDGRQDRWCYQDAKGNWHSTIGQHPQPYLRPALVNQVEDIKNLIFDAALREVRKK